MPSEFMCNMQGLGDVPKRRQGLHMVEGAEKQADALKQDWL